MIAPLAVGGFMAFYHGDETITPEVQAGINQLTEMGEPATQLGMSIQSMYTDTAPADHNIEIDLKTGAVTPL